VCVCVFTVARPTGQSDLRSGYRHDVSSIYAKIIGQGHGSKQCRLKCLRMQGNGIPASDYWQTAFLYLQVRKMHRNCRRNAIGTVVSDQMATSVQNNWSLIKHKYRLRKKKGKYGIEYSLARRTCIRWALLSWLAGHAENGVPSPQIFHFNRWVKVKDHRRKQLLLNFGWRRKSETEKPEPIWYSPVCLSHDVISKQYTTQSDAPGTALTRLSSGLGGPISARVDAIARRKQRC